MIYFYQRKDKVFAFDEDIFTRFRVAKIYWDKNLFKLEDYISRDEISMYFNLVFQLKDVFIPIDVFVFVFLAEVGDSSTQTDGYITRKEDQMKINTFDLL